MSGIKLFESKNIRSVWDESAQRWLFAVVDVVAALTDSANPQVYWRVLKKRLRAEGNETVTSCNALKMTAADGKQRLTDVADTEQLLRQREFAILTAEISRATFGMTPAEYKAFKALDKPTDNLRDHMNNLELIFTMLGEASTTEIARSKDAQGYVENRSAAAKGGAVAGRARQDLEQTSGKRITSKENYKQLPEAVARKRIKKDT
ncbi:MAG: hypothetical protein Q8L60_16980 [Gammaproteobacteria bacterium]|nr:hypothetical protein [Gammaproteobacteria bacterium]MDP2346919.1 hypothetical protein [Gammaproteobacteria bacterium]